MTRKRFEWKLRSAFADTWRPYARDGHPEHHPDSFSDAGRYDDPDRAFARAIELEEQAPTSSMSGSSPPGPDPHAFRRPKNYGGSCPY